MEKVEIKAIKASVYRKNLFWINNIRCHFINIYRHHLIFQKFSRSSRYFWHCIITIIQCNIYILNFTSYLSYSMLPKIAIRIYQKCLHEKNLSVMNKSNNFFIHPTAHNQLSNFT